MGNTVMPVEDAINLAVGHHQAGRLAEAEPLYRAILASFPDHADTNHNLGLLALQAGYAEQCLPYLDAAIAAEPHVARYHITKANALLSLGRTDEAKTLYRLAFEIDPDQVEVNMALSHFAQEAGDLDAAIVFASRVIATHPDFAEAHMALGNIFHQLGRTGDAIAAYHRATAAAPALPLPHYNLGIALHAQERMAEAAESFERAIAAKPDFLEALNFLGGTYWAMGRLDDSLAAYDRALAIDPGFIRAHHNKGNTLRDMGASEAAIESFRRVLAIDPNQAATHNSLGRVNEDLGRLDEAMVCYRQAVALVGDQAEARNNLGNVLMAMGRYDEALENYRIAVDASPNLIEPHRNYLLAVLYHPTWSAERRFAEHRRFEEHWARPHYQPCVAYANPRDPDRRLRIGYLSSDFRAHSVGRNLMPLIAGRDRSRFEVYLYAHVVRPDARTEAFRAEADGWRSIIGLSDADAARMIRADGIDILVILAGRFDQNRPLVAAHRPAPVQISFHDPATSGLDAIDYIIGDPVLIPPHGAELFSERPIRLPSFYIHAPMEDNPPVSPLPMLDNGFPTFGCFNSPAKLSDQTVQLWAKVMSRIPNARLVLKYRRLMGSVAIQSRIREMMAANGVDSDRIAFLDSRDSTVDHLALYHGIDIALDPFPFNGSTTTFEALWMGVPVVTLLGQTMLSRWSAAMLRPLDLGRLVAADPARYVDICAGLCADPAGLARLRAELRPRLVASPLCDTAGKTRHIQRIYRATWRRWCATPTEASAP